MCWGRGGQPGGQSVCPSVHPPAFGVAFRKFHRLPCVFWDAWRTFPYLSYLCPSVSLQKAQASIPRGWRKDYVDFPLFEILSQISLASMKMSRCLSVPQYPCPPALAAPGHLLLCLFPVFSFSSPQPSCQVLPKFRSEALPGLSGLAQNKPLSHCVHLSACSFLSPTRTEG